MNLYKYHKNMKLEYFLLLYLVLLNQTSFAQKYFEGKVIFEKSYEPLDSRLTSQLLTEYYGNRTIGLVQEKRYLMYVPLNSKDTLKIYYFLETCDGYIDRPNSDTIDHFNIDETPGILTKYELVDAEKLILGDKCKAVSIEYKPKEDYIDKVSGIYYFNPKYKLNKKYYVNHGESFWNLFVAKSGSISVRNEITYYPLYKAIYQASKIIEQKIDNNLFKLNPKKYINRIPR